MSHTSFAPSRSNIKRFARTRRITAVLGIAVTLALGATGCTTPNVQSSTSSSKTVAIPENGAGPLAKWVLDQLNSDGDIDEAVLKSKMDPSLLASLSEAELASAITKQRGTTHWAATAVSQETNGDTQNIYIRIEASKAKEVSVLQVARSEKSGLMTGIHFLPAGAVDFGS